MIITYSKSKDQLGKVANPAMIVVSLKENNNISLSPFAPENLVSRDGFDSPVPCQLALLHTQAESGAYLRDFSRFPRCPFIYLTRHTPSGQFRVYRVTQLRTDGVHHQEPAGTGHSKPQCRSSNGCCLSKSPWTN